MKTTIDNKLLSNVQRTKVESKSQHATIQTKLIYVVIKCTKNKSWKQITTSFWATRLKTMLLSNVQRTKVESKSQHVVMATVTKKSCYQMYKEQKLKANHNLNNSKGLLHLVVIKCTKNKSWKQITTIDLVLKKANELLSNVQRTKVESKSQRSVIIQINYCSCYQMYKEQKLKANHNRCRL